MTTAPTSVDDGAVMNAPRMELTADRNNQPPWPDYNSAQYPQFGTDDALPVLRDSALAGYDPEAVR